MKNKKIIYVLLPVVLIVWGYVGFSIFTFGEEEEEIEPIRIDQIVTDKDQKPMSKTLALNYADPFLKGVRNTPVRVRSVQKNKLATKKTDPVNWGEITYYGFIKIMEFKNKWF